MRRYTTLLFVCTLMILFSACHRTPDHAKYIPKNALMVAEVNTKELSKKIAWSMITGSSLWDKLKGSDNKIDSAKQSEFLKNMQEAGVDELNTFYAYLKNNGGAQNEDPCFVALVPLKDAMKWESFVRKTFADAAIKQNKKRKEAMLSSEIYAGWTNGLLVLVSVQKTQSFEDLDIAQNVGQQNNEQKLATHLEQAFNVSKENSLLNDKRFAAFEEHKHDLGFWVNVDALMSSYGTRNLDAMTGGLALSNTMWRNSAFSTATNFEKGRIVTDILMYSSDELKEINKQFAPQSVAEDAVNRISDKNLDFMLAYKMSPMATQKTIEKMGVLGLANNYLKQQGLSVEQIVEAFAGDMVFAVNNYTQTKETLYFDSSDASSAFANYKTDMDVLFAIKLNKRAAFQRLMDMAVEFQMLEMVADNQYKIKSLNPSGDSSLITLDNYYAVFANKASLAKGYLSGSLSKNVPLMVKQNVHKQPFALFFDFNNWAKRIGPVMASNAADSLVFEASINTFKNLVFNGGTIKDNTYKYTLSIQFVNTKESTLIQLLEFGKTLQQAQELREKEEERFANMMMQDTLSTMF